MIATEQDKKDIKSIVDTEYKRDVVLRVFAHSILQGTQVTAPEIRQCLQNAVNLMKLEEEKQEEIKNMNQAV